jgi:hypothetical protein
VILTPLQKRLVPVVAAVGRRYDLALGGSLALQALGIIERPTEDFDTYSRSSDPALYEAVERDIVSACRQAKLSASVSKSMDWFRCIDVSDPVTGEEVKIDVGMMGRTNKPIDDPTFGQVLAIEDQRAAKVDALATRAAARDYLDVDAIVRTGNWRITDIDEYVTKFHPEITRDEWVATLRGVRLVAPAEFAAYAVDGADLSAMSTRFADWARRLSQAPAESNQAGTSRGHRPRPDGPTVDL